MKQSPEAGVLPGGLLALSIGALLLAAPAAQGQPSGPIVTPAAHKEGTIAGTFALSGFESVNIHNGNLIFELPLLEIAGRGAARSSIALTIQRRFPIVDYLDEFTQQHFAYPRLDWQQSLPLGEPFFVGASYRATYPFLRRADGAENYFVAEEAYGAGCRFRPALFGPATLITDSVPCHAPIDTYFPAGYLLEADGTRYRVENGRVQWLQDRNGNRVAFARPNPDTLEITDSLERKVTVTHATASSPFDHISYRGANGAARTIRVHRADLSQVLSTGAEIRTLVELFPTSTSGLNWRPPSFYGDPPCDGDINNPYCAFNPRVTESVELPDGRRYRFRYNEYGELVQVRLPTGGEFHYSWGPGAAPYNRSYRRVLERVTVDADGAAQTRETYSLFGPKGHEIVRYDPKDGDVVIARERHYTLGDPNNPEPIAPPFWGDPLEGREWKAEFLTPSDELLKRVENVWTAGVAGATLKATTTTLEGKVSKETYKYDDYANRTEVSSYDFGQTGSPLRRVQREFLKEAAYTGLETHTRNLPTTERIYDGGDELAAQTLWGYDESPLLARDPVSGHDQSYGPGRVLRGNLTSTTRLLLETGGAVVSRSEYDVLGNVWKALDPLRNPTFYHYDDRWGISAVAAEPSGTVTYAFATLVSNSLDHHAYTRYDYDTGQVVQLRDPNGVFTELHYDDPLDRLTEVIAASNKSERSRTSYRYDDDRRIITTRSDLRAYNDQVLHSDSRHDGLGRLKEARQYEDGGWIATRREYDGLGRVSDVSNPFRSGEPEWTITKYDALGRVSIVTTPDDATTTTSYVGNETTVTDPAGKKRKSVADTLGRVTALTEDPGGGSHAVTFYAYDALDNLTGVEQDDQTRTFEYDSLSRLTSATNPESGEVKYKYDKNGNLEVRTDARGVVTTYDYDELNRIKRRAYGHAPGAAPTESVTYRYDQSGSYPSGRLTSVQTAISETVYDEYDALGRVTAHHQRTNGRVYGTAYHYNRAGLLSSETYPTGRVLSIEHDSAGRISGITGGKPGASRTTFLEPGEVSYAAHGAIEAMQLGNALWENTHFNSRLQPRRIGLGPSRGDSGLLELAYGYGGNDNNGNVLSQTIGVGPASFQQTYTYDRLNRLETATETKDGSLVWSQTFGHDRFGNRWVPDGYRPNPYLTPDAPNDFDASTNRIAMPATLYDMAGNLTQDTLERAFDYDGENRQARFAAEGAVVQYGYDGDGRRVIKREGDARTWVYVYDANGRLITEHSNEDLTRPAKDFVYAGARLLAEVKGAMGSGVATPIPLGPKGTVDNCAEDATFNFWWLGVPGATKYRLRVDGEVLATYVAKEICSAELLCLVEPQAHPEVEPFAPGPHTWAVQLIRGATEGEWSPEEYYVIGPRPATPLSPSGSLIEPPTTFTWKHSPAATEFKLFIDGVLYGTWPPDEICEAEAETCTATLEKTPTLEDGKHSWRVHGVFPQCELSSLPLSFSLKNLTLCGATMTHPYFNGTVGPDMVFQWLDVPEVDEYPLTVVDPQGVTHSWPLADSEVCRGFYCHRYSRDLGWTPGAGLHYWKLTIGGEACDAWPFTVDTNYPWAVVPISPSGRITALTQTFRWYESTNATEYYLAVEGANPNIYLRQASEICSGGVCEIGGVVIQPALCRFAQDPDPRCSWSVLARNAIGISTWSEPLIFWYDEPPDPFVCSGVGSCRNVCTSLAPCDAPCLDPYSDTLTTCQAGGGACDGRRTCSTCAQLGGNVCGECPEGSTELGATVDCDFQSCCRTVQDSCEELAGEGHVCSGEGGSCPRGYEGQGPSADCAECCKQGPSCGALGGDYCKDAAPCPPSYTNLGPTYDCGACCDCQSTGCEEGACGTQFDNCGQPIDCGPCPPPCEELAGEGYFCSDEVGYCPRGYSRQGRSADCTECCKQGPSCGALGGDICKDAAPCPASHQNLGPTYDCGACCDCQSTGCQEGACGTYFDNCGQPIDCGPCPPPCEELAGEGHYCSDEVGYCPRGYAREGRSADCAECCKQGPSCGALGGDLCRESAPCPTSYQNLGPTYDCGACCDYVCQSTGCPEDACGSQTDNCGNTIDCGPCPCESTGCPEGACGSQTDNCGNTIDCGPCPCESTGCPEGACGSQTDNCGQPIECGACPCESTGCPEGACGSQTDNCGNTIDCGPCPCESTGCPEGACGSQTDNCGNTIECGPCPCESTGCPEGACGSQTDNCGNTIECGPCPCESTGCPEGACGSQTDNCGQPIECGACPCESTGCPEGACGSQTDNCGNTIECGACPCESTGCPEDACGSQTDNCGDPIECEPCPPKPETSSVRLGWATAAPVSRTARAGMSEPSANTVNEPGQCVSICDRSPREPQVPGREQLINELRSGMVR